MRAAQVHEVGGLPAVGDAEAPAGDDVVEVLAAPVNPIDLAVSRGILATGHPPAAVRPGLRGRGTDGRRRGRVGVRRRPRADRERRHGRAGRDRRRDGDSTCRTAPIRRSRPASASPASPGWLPLAWRAPLTRRRERPRARSDRSRSGSSPCRRRSCSAPPASSPPDGAPTGLERAAALGADATVSTRRGRRPRRGVQGRVRGRGAELRLRPCSGARPSPPRSRPRSRARRSSTSASRPGATAELASAAVRFKNLSILGHTNFAVPEDELDRALPPTRRPRHRRRHRLRRRARPARRGRVRVAAPGRGRRRYEARARPLDEARQALDGATRRRSAGSHRQTDDAVTCVPPTQRSIPSALDAVGFAAQHALALRGQAQRQAGEDLRCRSSGGGGGSSARRSPVSTSRACPCPSAGRGAVEPRVAEERGVLESLRGDEGGRRRAGARRRSPRAPAARCPRARRVGAGSSSSSRSQRGREKRELPRSLASPNSTRAPWAPVARKAAQAARRRLEQLRPFTPDAVPARASRARRRSARRGRRRTACRGRSRRRSASGAASAACASASTSSSCSWS